MSKKHIIQYYFVIIEQRDVASAELVIQSEKVNKYYSKAVDNSTGCGAKLCASIQQGLKDVYTFGHLWVYGRFEKLCLPPSLSLLHTHTHTLSLSLARSALTTHSHKYHAKKQEKSGFAQFYSKYGIQCPLANLHQQGESCFRR